MSHKVLTQQGIFIRRHLLTPLQAGQVLEAMRTSPGTQAAIHSSAGDAIDERIRRSRSVELPAGMSASIDRVLNELHPELERHFHVSLAGHEPPQSLLYRAGDFFAAHRDRPSAADSDLATRRVSVVRFLNDDFDGGELRFFGVLEGEPWETIGFPCPAEPGLLVAFRSDLRHEVAPVTAGVRGTIVTWFF